jgi:hypothetical protein
MVLYCTIQWKCRFFHNKSNL